jgi:hypothetical protein
MDFLGALVVFAMALPDTGGYWLCLRGRVPSGPDGGSIVPVEVVEDMLLCLIELLCRRIKDPVRAGRGPFNALAGTATLASDVSMAANGRFSGKMLCSPVNLASKLKSLVTPAMLLARSSKLGDGRKS